jgi:hypothetical protein
MLLLFKKSQNYKCLGNKSFTKKNFVLAIMEYGIPKKELSILKKG